MKTITTLTAAMSLGLASSQANATTYLVVSPPPAELSRTDAEAVFKSFPELVLRGDVDDEVLIYDGVNARMLASTTIGAGPNHIRLKKSDPAIRAALAVYRQAKADASSSAVNLPRIAREIIRPKVRAGEDVRVLLYGDPFDSIGDNPIGDFDPGEIPSEGHITQEHTPWSAHGREEDLDEAVVSWIYLAAEGEPNERDAAFRFYTKWFGAQGATLTQVLPIGQGNNAMQSLIGDKHTPWADVEIDKSDTEVVIRKLKQATVKDADPQEREIELARINAIAKGNKHVQRLHARGLFIDSEPVTFVFLVDCSSSWWNYRPDVLASIDEGIEIILQHSPWVRCEVIPFREAALDRFEMQTIRSNRPSRPQLTKFLTGMGSEGANVDIQTLSITTLAELGKVRREGRVCWCLLTDTDVTEWKTAGRSAQRNVVRAVRKWSAEHSGHYVMAAYVGDDKGSDAAGRMQEIAEAAGRQGIYTDNRNRLIEELVNVALKK